MKNIKKYSGVLLATAVVVGGVTSATFDFSTLPGADKIKDGAIIQASDILSLSNALTALDGRTNGTAPTVDTDLVNKGFLDSEIINSFGRLKMTSQRYSGNLGGINGANDKCSSEFPGTKLFSFSDNVPFPVIDTRIGFDIYGIVNDSILNCNNWTSDDNTMNYASHRILRQSGTTASYAVIEQKTLEFDCSATFPLLCL